MVHSSITKRQWPEMQYHSLILNPQGAIQAPIQVNWHWNPTLLVLANQAIMFLFVTKGALPWWWDLHCNICKTLIVQVFCLMISGCLICGSNGKEHQYKLGLNFIFWFISWHHMTARAIQLCSLLIFWVFNAYSGSQGTVLVFSLKLGLKMWLQWVNVYDITSIL